LQKLDDLALKPADGEHRMPVFYCFSTKNTRNNKNICEKSQKGVDTQKIKE